MTYVELNIDPKFHRHIVGRSGTNSQSPSFTRSLIARFSLRYFAYFSTLNGIF